MSLVTDHLAHRGVRFELLPHAPTTTAREEAAVLGMSTLEVLKVLVLNTSTGHALAVIPCYRRLDLDRVRRLLGERHVHLASEQEILRDLPEFELGAVPPLPSLLHLPTLIEPEVFRHSKVTFAGGVRRGSVRLDPHELLAGATVTVAPIAGPFDARMEPANTIDVMAGQV